MAARPVLEVIREGNPSRRPVRSMRAAAGPMSEPRWADVFPDPSDPRRRDVVLRLRKVARAQWRLVASQVADRAGAVDASALSAYCVAVALHDQAVRGLAADGQTMDTPTGAVKPTPWPAQLRDASAAMRTGQRLFGLTPADRSGFAPVDQSADDPFA